MGAGGGRLTLVGLAGPSGSPGRRKKQPPDIRIPASMVWAAAWAWKVLCPQAPQVTLRGRKAWETRLQRTAPSAMAASLVPPGRASVHVDVCGVLCGVRGELGRERISKQ